ncbi:hypothetical protein M0812_10142 [Anaeramoeba flamelloides]|uniref:Uncharacterized protein n=1 Tax=Anaeramoeba flamelloides TaxID=1746091 RepID=A0AAV7ZT11_9EUKA|nr:hypothetical protein M0812_10142 [Anaeramoeba flamelloides]
MSKSPSNKVPCPKSYRYSKPINKIKLVNAKFGRSNKKSKESKLSKKIEQSPNTQKHKDKKAKSDKKFSITNPNKNKKKNQNSKTKKYNKKETNSHKDSNYFTTIEVELSVGSSDEDSDYGSTYDHSFTNSLTKNDIPLEKTNTMISYSNFNYSNNNENGIVDENDPLVEESHVYYSSWDIEDQDLFFNENEKNIILKNFKKKKIQLIPNQKKKNLKRVHEEEKKKKKKKKKKREKEKEKEKKTDKFKNESESENVNESENENYIEKSTGNENGNLDKSRSVVFGKNNTVNQKKQNKKNQKKSDQKKEKDKQNQVKPNSENIKKTRKLQKDYINSLQIHFFNLKNENSFLQEKLSERLQIKKQLEEQVQKLKQRKKLKTSTQIIQRSQNREIEILETSLCWY